jgi:hypothetical protein
MSFQYIKNKNEADHKLIKKVIIEFLESSAFLEVHIILLFLDGGGGICFVLYWIFLQHCRRHQEGLDRAQGFGVNFDKTLFCCLLPWQVFKASVLLVTGIFNYKLKC